MLNENDFHLKNTKIFVSYYKISTQKNTLTEQRFLYKTELLRKKEKGRKVNFQCQQPGLS